MQVTWNRLEGREMALFMTSDMAVLAVVSAISHDPKPDMKSTNYNVRVHGVDRGAVASMNEGMAFAEVTLQNIYRAQLEGIERLRDLRNPEPVRSLTRGTMDTGPRETASDQIEHLQGVLFNSFLMGSMETQSSSQMVTKDLFSKLSRNFRVSKINTDLVTDIISVCRHHMLTADLSKAILCGLQAYESAKLLPSTKDQACAIKDLCVDLRLFKVVSAKVKRDFRRSDLNNSISR